MTSYRELDSFIRVYFGQDYDLIADSIEGLVAEFTNSISPEYLSALRDDIARFLAQEEVEAEFESRDGFEVNLAGWGHTATSFLRKIDELLAQHQQEKRGQAMNGSRRLTYRAGEGIKASREDHHGRH